ncbi:hypothetical protein WN943_003060 [Citrus x changshan-huyou]
MSVKHRGDTRAKCIGSFSITQFAGHLIFPQEHSSAKCTLTEIAKILIEKILDEERESHSKKPRWAMHKMKADEKKDKQPTAWVWNLLENNDIVELKRGKVESLLPMVNLPARSVSQGAFDGFSNWSATHALELLVRNQAENEETACLAKDLVTKKRSNTSKDSKITKLSQKLEKVKFDVDQHIRLEKRRLKADVIQTCMGLFQEKHSDIEFQWMLIAYVSRKN